MYAIWTERAHTQIQAHDSVWWNIHSVLYWTKKPTKNIYIRHNTVCVQVIDMWLSLLVQPIAIQIQLNQMDDRARARALAYVVCLGVQTIVVRLLPGFGPQCRNYRHVYRWANKTLAMPVHCANVYKFAIMDSVNDKYGTEPRARARLLARSLVCVFVCMYFKLDVCIEYRNPFDRFLFSLFLSLFLLLRSICSCSWLARFWDTFILP